MSSSGVNKGARFSRLLIINSNDRKSGTSTDFKINMGSNLQLITGFSIASVSFFNNFYNIYSNDYASNNKITISVHDSKTSTTETVTYLEVPSFYTYNELLDQLAVDFAALATLPVALTYSYNNMRNKITITITQAATYTTTISSPYTDTSNPWPLYQLGFNETSYVFTGASTTYTAGSAPRMSGVNTVYVQSSALSPGNAFDENGTQSDVTIPIPVYAPYKSKNIFECKVDDLCQVIYEKPRNLSSIDIQLVDHYGRPLNNQGSEVELQLRVWFNTF